VFALEGCTGWRYVTEELAAAGVAAHVAEPADTAFARGRKRHAKTGKTGSRHLRQLLAEGRLPECWIPPGHILECRALLELYHDRPCGQVTGLPDRRQAYGPSPLVKFLHSQRCRAYGHRRTTCGHRAMQVSGRGSDLAGASRASRLVAQRERVTAGRAAEGSGRSGPA
jgi:hypothetical protein